MHYTILFKFHQHALQRYCKECVERLETSNVSINNGSTEEFERQIYYKIIIPMGISCNHLFTDADIGSVKSLHTLFDKNLDHTLVNFNQNRMVRTIQKLSFLTKQKWLIIFDQVLTLV